VLRIYEEKIEENEKDGKDDKFGGKKAMQTGLVGHLKEEKNCDT